MTNRSCPRLFCGDAPATGSSGLILEDRGHLEPAGVPVYHANVSPGFDARMQSSMSTKGRDANQCREVYLGGDVSKARLDVCRLSEGRVERIANTTEAIAAQLTLGENATLVVDEFIYDPFRSRGALLLISLVWADRRLSRLTSKKPGRDNAKERHSKSSGQNRTSPR